MSFALQPIADATARALLAQLLKRNLLPVATGISEVIAASPLSGNGSVASPVALTGAVPRSLGGTGGTATPTAGGAAYGSGGTALAYTAAGTAGQLLKSNGANAPTWMTPPAALVASVLGADLTTDLDTGVRVSDDWVWRCLRWDVLSLHFQLAVLGTAIAAPRFGLFTDIAGEWVPANGRIRTLSFVDSLTVPAWGHLSVGSLTPAVTASVPTTITIWNLDAVLTMPDDGEVELRVASSDSGETVRVLAGSFAESNLLRP
jgi:hypothetical protein